MSTAFDGLRILLVGPLPPPAGGMANQTRQLAALLQGAGATVELVQTNRPYRPAWLDRLRGIRAVARLLQYGGQLWGGCGRNDVMHLMANSGWSWHLVALPALCLARMRGLPVVVNYRGGGAAAFMTRSARLVKPAMRLAAALIVPSGYLAQVFGDFGVQARIVPNIIDLQRFHQPAEPTGAVHLVVTRNLEPVYDNATAIRVLQRVRHQYPQATLTLAGSGPERARLEALTQELDLQAHVRFSGRLDPDAMADLYRQATVVLNPSLTDNMPNSVLEAMASGVPVVSTDVGGVPFLLEHEATGLLVPPGQPEQMAQAVLRLLDNQAVRERLSANALREVQRYTWSQVAPQLLGVYRQMLSAPAASVA